MKCPKCNSDLSIEKFKGVEVDRCPSCKGLWLDYHEMDQLEDKEMKTTI